MNKCLNEKILSYDTRVPRYTSYPTAPQFNNKVTNDTYTSWLQKIEEGTAISLYIHIPFCSKLCWYCGCYTKITNLYTPIKKYIELLKEEIQLLASTMEGKRHIVNHIHFGGGSPTIIRPEDFSELMTEVRAHFTLTAETEIALEIDPRGITEGKIATYAKEGVNRVSIGVQDFHEHVQKAVNRVQPFRCVHYTVKLLKEYGINDFNIDLMYGLPTQTIEDIKENIAYAVALNPNRVAFFGYAHVPWLKKHMRLIDESQLPGAEERLLMFQEASSRLNKEGYTSVGIDHFVKPDDVMAKALQEGELKRNFQGYTTDSSDIMIGIGVSAIGRLEQGYVQNTLNQKAYEEALKNNTFSVEKGVSISKDDKIRHAIIEQLMCTLEVNLESICAQYEEEASAFDSVIESLSAIEKDGLIKIKDRTITVLPEARPIARLVCAEFDQYYKPEENNRHSKVA